MRIHEYGLAFAGKFCIAAVHTFCHSNSASAWQEVDRGCVVIPEPIPEMLDDEDDGGDEDHEGDSQDDSLLLIALEHGAEKTIQNTKIAKNSKRKPKSMN
jgi:hypothetical protein